MNDKLKEVLQNLPFKPTKDQERACIACTSGKNVFVASGPGTGKSTIVKALVEYFGDKLLLGSTTGISNQRLLDGNGGAGSMSRIFSLPFGLHTEENSKKVSRFTSELLSKNKNIEYILIDESGFMLNSDSLALIYKRIQRFNKKTRNRPRRDIKLILMGDVSQLPAFADSDDMDFMRKEYGNFFFFKSELFSKMAFEVVIMKEVKRTDNKTFLACQDVLRYAQEDRYDNLLKWVNKIMYKPIIPEGLPLMSCWVREAEKANTVALEANPNKPFTYVANTSGKFNMKNCPVGETFTIKEGALIIMKVNDLELGRFSNGSIARVSSSVITTEGFYAIMEHSGYEVFIEPHLFEQSEKRVQGEVELPNGEVKSIVSDEVVGTCVIPPAVLAYGMSVHAQQGNNISTPCVVDLGQYGFSNPDRFGASLTYTAITRFTDPSLIYLKYPLTRNHLHVNKEILEWVLEQEAKQES